MHCMRRFGKRTQVGAQERRCGGSSLRKRSRSAWTTLRWSGLTSWPTMRGGEPCTVVPTSRAFSVAPIAL
eukprot:5639179-Pleurochrysis_carterae.AAC.1